MKVPIHVLFHIFGSQCNFSTIFLVFLLLICFCNRIIVDLWIINIFLLIYKRSKYETKNTKFWGKKSKEIII